MSDIVIDATPPSIAREFRAMDHTGDGLKLTWRSDVPGEVNAARDTFQSYRDRGFTLYRLGEGDERGERITEFDPQANGILAVPRMVGG